MNDTENNIIQSDNKCIVTTQKMFNFEASFEVYIYYVRISSDSLLVIDTDTPTFILVVGCGNDLVQPIQINDPPIVLLQQSKISNSI